MISEPDMEIKEHMYFLLVLFSKKKERKNVGAVLQGKLAAMRGMNKTNE